MIAFKKTVLIALITALGFAGCATTETAAGGSSLMFAETDDPMAASSQEATTQDFSWKKPPAPIAGKWVVTGCEQKKGMIVEFSVSGGKAAAGEVVEAGKTELLGYTAGESMFKELVSNEFGAWRGRHKWRNAFGVERWDPIYLVMDGDQLSAKMTTDPCLKKMERLP